MLHCSQNACRSPIYLFTNRQSSSVYTAMTIVFTTVVTGRRQAGSIVFADFSSNFVLALCHGQQGTASVSFRVFSSRAVYVLFVDMNVEIWQLWLHDVY